MVRAINKSVKAVIDKNKQMLDLKQDLSAAIKADIDENKRKQLREMNEINKKIESRGNALLDAVEQMNFFFIYGCRPSSGVKANTTMMKDIHKALMKR